MKQIWHYKENKFYTHITYTTVRALFIYNINSYRYDLQRARERAKIANKSLKAAKDNLTICFRKYPHSDIVLMAKERYHNAKQEWKVASDEVSSKRYFLAEACTAYNKIRDILSKELLDMQL